MANKLCPENGNIDSNIDKAAKPSVKNFTKDGKIMSYIRIKKKRKKMKYTQRTTANG